MRFPQLIIYETDGRLAQMLEGTAGTHRWVLRQSLISTLPSRRPHYVWASDPEGELRRGRRESTPSVRDGWP